MKRMKPDMWKRKDILKMTDAFKQEFQAQGNPALLEKVPETIGTSEQESAVVKRPSQAYEAKLRREAAQKELMELAMPKLSPGAWKAVEAMAVPAGRKPKLIITGRSTMNGRGATLMRIRPTIWRDLEELEVTGTRQYLVVEAALRMLIGHLQSLPEDKPMMLDAATMAATPEDHRLLEEAGRVVKKIPRKRVSKTSYTDPEENKRALSK
jgi:hypothetical protein